MPIRRSPNSADHTRPQPGRDHPEWVVAINRNRWSHSIGISGRNQPVRAPSLCVLNGDYTVRICRVDSTATRERVGRNCLSSSSRFVSPPAVCEERPVTFPLGRTRLATSPAPRGSPADMTIGLTLFALSAAGVPLATMTSTGSPTNSAANFGNRSAAPSANRYSTMKSLPS